MRGTSAVLLGLMTFVMSAVSPNVANAFPLTSKRPWVSYTVELVQPGFNHDGIVALSNCSGSFVRFANTSDDAKGLLLTNGHCTGGMFGGMPQPGEFYYHKPANFSVNLLNQKAARIASLSANQIVYATMTDTDLAILQLTKTYREIRQATGVEALVIDTQHPTAGTQIEIPSGYWKRTYACQIDGFVHQLKEGGWLFKDSIRYSETGCEVIGGTSGSPIVSSATGKVIAINNTGNEDGDRCTVNNPCEIDENGKTTVLKGRNYGQQTYTLYSCLNQAGEIDLSVAGCQLPH